MTEVAAPVPDPPVLLTPLTTLTTAVSALVTAIRRRGVLGTEVQENTEARSELLTQMSALEADGNNLNAGVTTHETVIADAKVATIAAIEVL